MKCPLNCSYNRSITVCSIPFPKAQSGLKLFCEEAAFLYGWIPFQGRTGLEASWACEDGSSFPCQVGIASVGGTLRAAEHPVPTPCPHASPAACMMCVLCLLNIQAPGEVRQLLDPIENIQER